MYKTCLFQTVGLPVAAWMPGCSVFHRREWSRAACWRKTLSYVSHALPPCLCALRITRRAYASTYIPRIWVWGAYGNVGQETVRISTRESWILPADGVSASLEVMGTPSHQMPPVAGAGRCYLSAGPTCPHTGLT